ncbi:unnamed protein product [Notodromas monacha]|uniref:Uncharacterized protein n=1 Tax=Notodromas monacha TaxID=399045 RepID=A0A7R9BQA8_9CRUS|nr:unnamed protein product [Notodromas monacha]CAG0919696.1 unnamed protein product [Notodromas monacha]
MGSEEKFLFCLGKRKFWQEDGELTSGVGPFAVGLEYACGVRYGSDRETIGILFPGRRETARDETRGSCDDRG